MVRRDTWYKLLRGGWVVLVVGAFIVVMSGNAEPYVSRSQVPSLEIAAAGAAGIAVAGFVVVSVFRIRAWTTMGRAVGLSPGSSLLPIRAPDLTGTHDGRPVRVRTDTRTRSSSGESGSTTYAVTVVEAELTGAGEGGAFVARGSNPDADIRVDATEDGAPTALIGDDYDAFGSSDGLLAELNTARVQSALDDAGAYGPVLVGDAAGALQAAFDRPDLDGLSGKLHSFVAGSAIEALEDDPETVSTELDWLLLDAEELERQLDVVVALADEFEGASSQGAG